MRITTPENDIQRVLFTREQIEARVRELGACGGIPGQAAAYGVHTQGRIGILYRPLQGNGLRGVYGLHSGIQLRRKL